MCSSGSPPCFISSHFHFHFHIIRNPTLFASHKNLLDIQLLVMESKYWKSWGDFGELKIHVAGKIAVQTLQTSEFINVDL